MVVADDDSLALRNLVADWHLANGMPTCDCDDETADEDFCEPSLAWARERLLNQDSPELQGPPDKWQHDMWVTAWGRNLPLVVSNSEYQLPRAPEGTNWLLTRMLVRGNKVIELALMRLTKDKVVVVARSRVLPSPETIVARARVMLQKFSE